MRNSDPAWLIAEIDATLAKGEPTEVDVTRAIELATRCISLARDRETIELAQNRKRHLLRALARLQSHRDTTVAIATAKSALAEFPADAALGSDLVVLLALHGNPFEALERWERLLATAPDRTKAIADTVVDAIRQRSSEHLSAKRTAEAVRLLARAVLVFPRRAELRWAYARALSRSDPRTALAQAREAAALDPSFADEAEQLARTVNRSTEEVVIPFDPRTNVIDATVSVSGANVSFVVDTGATTTTIPSAIARQLGVLSPSNPRTQVETAGGRIEGEIVLLPWIQIGSIRVTRVRAIVLDLPGTRLQDRGLLGMNVLRRLDFQIDGAAGRLILKKSRRNR